MLETFTMSTIDRASEFEFIEGLTAELSSNELVFPTSLNATMKIRRALNNPSMSNDVVVRIIGAEPVLSAQVLKLSNSPLFNRSGKREFRSSIRHDATWLFCGEECRHFGGDEAISGE